MEQWEFLFIAGENAEWYGYFRRQFGDFTQTNIFSPDDPAITLLGYYPKELRTYVHTKKSVHTRFVSFIHNGQNLKATNMSSVGE